MTESQSEWEWSSVSSLLSGTRKIIKKIFGGTLKIISMVLIRRKNILRSIDGIFGQYF